MLKFTDTSEVNYTADALLNDMRMNDWLQVRSDNVWYSTLTLFCRALTLRWPHYIMRK